MELEAIIKLASTGNFKDVEQHWMSVIERSDVTAADVVALAPIIDAYVEVNKSEQAESLAWAAVETLKEGRSVEDALRAIKPFLLRLNKSADLKRLAAELYEAVFAGRAGLEALIEESGIAGGRPPRRAIRTLDVCLGVQPGSYVIHRDGESATRVESVETARWEITVGVGERSESWGPVEFADRFTPCDDDDFRVWAEFDRDRLTTLVRKDPAELVAKVLATHGNRLDSDALQEILTPRILSPEEWSKWWTRARAAIKRSRHIKIEGRSPYTMEYVSGGHDFQDEFLARFKALGSPADELSSFERFLRDCKARGETPAAAALKEMRDAVSQRCDRLSKTQADAALAGRIVESEINRALGEEAPDRAAAALLSSSADPGRLIKSCRSAALWRHAAACLRKARPEDWSEVLASVFPWSPSPACDDLADLLDAGDLPSERVGQLVEAIVSESVAAYPSLCWMWDKGLDRERWRSTPPITVLTRMLWLLGEVQRGDHYPPAMVKHAYATIRAALSARKYERFVACLETIEGGMAAALRTQVQRLDNLGRKVEHDLLGHIRRRFPGLYKKVQKPMWEREDVIYATREGIARYEGEINELVNVKMRENAKAIGEAAQKGDLSENSEYKFALEERDLLRARLAQMQKQTAIAQPLDPKDVPDDHVSVGSRVTVRRVPGGDTLDLTFLGPFEAQADAHIYNYQAPLAQAFMGSGVGDRIELAMATPAGVYEIIGLRPWTDA